MTGAPRRGAGRRRSAAWPGGLPSAGPRPVPGIPIGITLSQRGYAVLRRFGARRWETITLLTEDPTTVTAEPAEPERLRGALREIIDALEAAAEGDFDARAEVDAPGPLSRVAQAAN